MFRNKGFTLIEFVVYTGLFAIVIVFLFRVLIGGLDSQGKGKAKEVVTTDAVSAINAIDFQIRHAASIYNSTSDFSANPGQLSLFTKQDFAPGEKDAYVDIFVNNDDRLCIKKERTGVECITSEASVVTTLDFDKTVLQDGSDDGVKTTITLEYDTATEDNKVPFTLESFTQVRN